MIGLRVYYRVSMCEAGIGFSLCSTSLSTTAERCIESPAGVWQGRCICCLALLTYGHLSASERMSAIAGALAFVRPQAEKLDAVSFASWLQTSGQADTTVRLLWDLVGTAILNGHADQISAGLAAQSFHMGFMRGWQRHGWGCSHAPLAISLATPSNIWLREASTYATRLMLNNCTWKRTRCLASICAMAHSSRQNR
ncbi:hypothetical protein [Alicyclobacillus sacchari]|uniref:hypothetical protein n=1 Tax=Alicyclobacillus sacchari TaxID=392010 RepID=UPI0024E0D9AB|nr:hypothetical protein [Alicyclobacillus sacchari]